MASVLRLLTTLRHVAGVRSHAAARRVQVGVSAAHGQVSLREGSHAAGEAGEWIEQQHSRWLVFCDSLPHYDTSLVFGRTLLRAVFKSVCRQLMDKCHSERDRMPPEKRVSG
ncbi:hypothetical protein PYW07_006373 [Mythimna separata]|uniref:PCAF N-terminal domain-containing protein n=1 Tax=Mythimna separata TaxID=271217 RepID=A0AAD7YW67_MYTSE|nr:hypothetical protein PYW07_006370 [Mythimna separata]KAJ8728675.1 hypothetical protein PYW07_006371 [Mythimna separata]KAJ8728676.1 hypothetical protein PYW07_006372 [Mythimna separata]KAJ8728677.1 hypothetical protein PYW07_006373 [Mythimna separata]